MTSIQPIQNQNIYRVNPINMFENKQDNAKSSNIFETGLFANQKNTGYNLQHPRIQGSETQAKNLDLLA